MAENNETKDQYIGPYKVFGLVKVYDYQTPSGKDVIKVLFEGRQFQIMTQKAFDKFVSSEPVEPTTYRENVTEEVSTEIIKTVMEYNLNNADLSYVLKVAGNRMLDGYERAINQLWTGDDKEWIPGVVYADTRTIMEADMIQKGKNPFKDERKGKQENNT